MKTNTYRLFGVPIIVVVILGLILMTAILPMVKMDPKDIPIGLVVDDEGEIGETLADKLLENAPDIVKFTRFDSIEQLESAMDERDVYGALVLPADFSSKVGTLQTDAPEKATVQIHINEGANATVSTLVQTALTNMVTMLNTQLSTQMLTAVQEKTDEMKEQLAPVLQAEGEDSPLAEVGAMISPIQPSKVQDYASPIQSEVIKVNETGNLGNAPIAFFMVTWFTSLIGGVVLFVVGNKQKFASKGDKLKFNTLQSIMPFVYALIAGYVATWYSTWLLDFEFEHFNRIALYIAICVAAFTFMIFATLRWLKLPSIVIYVLLMFFSMPAVQLAPEMLPSFYRDYVVSWLPIRIYADGLKEVLFFSSDVINNYSVTLIWILVIALILVWVKNLIEKPEIK
jgi:YhgE/Pip-like protein